MTERQIENAICRHAEAMGGVSLKLKLDGQRGFPDRTVLLPGGRVVFLEVKKPGGRLTKQQLAWLEQLRALGFRAEVVFDVDRAKFELKGGRKVWAD